MLSPQGPQLTSSNPSAIQRKISPPAAVSRATAEDRSLRIDTSSTVDSAPHGEEEEDRGAVPPETEAEKSSMLRGGQGDLCAYLLKDSPARSLADGPSSLESEGNTRPACDHGPPLCYASLNTEVPGTLFTPDTCSGRVKAEIEEGDGKSEEQRTRGATPKRLEETRGTPNENRTLCGPQLQGKEAQATAPCAPGEEIAQAAKETSPAPGVDHEQQHHSCESPTSRRQEERLSLPDSRVHNSLEEGVTTESILRTSDFHRLKETTDAPPTRASKASEYCRHRLPPPGSGHAKPVEGSDSPCQPAKDTPQLSDATALIASDLLDITPSDLRSFLSSETPNCSAHATGFGGAQRYGPACQPSAPSHQPPLTSYSAPAASGPWVPPEKGKERRCISGKKPWPTSCQSTCRAKLCPSPCFEGEGRPSDFATPTCFSPEDRKGLAWSEGFSLPLGKLGRQKLLRQLRLKYHTNRELWRSRLQESGFEVTSLPRMGVEQLWAVANFMGLFDVAVEIAFEHATSKRCAGWQQSKYESCPECPAHSGQFHVGLSGGSCSSDSGSEQKYLFKKGGQAKEAYSDEESGQDGEGGLDAVRITRKHSGSCSCLSAWYMEQGGEEPGRRCCSSSISRATSEEPYGSGLGEAGSPRPPRPRGVLVSRSCWKGEHSEHKRRRCPAVDVDVDSVRKVGTRHACRDFWTRAQAAEFLSLSRLAVKRDGDSPEPKSGFCSSSFSFSPSSSLAEHPSSVGRSEDNKDTPPRDSLLSPRGEVHLHGGICSSPASGLNARWGGKGYEEGAMEDATRRFRNREGASIHRKRKGGTGEGQARACLNLVGGEDRGEGRGGECQRSRDSKKSTRAQNEDDDIVEQSIALLCEQLIKMASRRRRDADEERPERARSGSGKEALLEQEDSEVYDSCDSRSGDMTDEQEWPRRPRGRPPSQVEESSRWSEGDEESADRTLVALCGQLVKLSHERNSRVKKEGRSTQDLDRRRPSIPEAAAADKEGNVKSFCMRRSEIDAHLAHILEELFVEGDEMILEDLRRLHFQTSESAGSALAEVKSEVETPARTPENLACESACQEREGQDEVLRAADPPQSDTAAVSSKSQSCDTGNVTNSSVRLLSCPPRTPSRRRGGQGDPDGKEADALLPGGMSGSRPEGEEIVGHGSRGALPTRPGEETGAARFGGEGHVTDDENLRQHKLSDACFSSKKRKTEKEVDTCLAELVLERIQDIQSQLELLRQQIHSLVSA